MQRIFLSWLESTAACPVEQIRLDEELLMAGRGVLRLWETEQECVVLGHAGQQERDVHVSECRRAGVAILRRCSGGGAGLLGPGCLNYSLVLPLEWERLWCDVRYSFAWTLRTTIHALGVPGLRREGDSDLALHHRKVSGNAQRRTRGAILHHGTLLYNFDAARTERFLKPPHREPAYRAGRTHAEFLGNLPLSAGQIRQRLLAAWCRRDGSTT
jgi:lipoate-protein ligase A